MKNLFAAILFCASVAYADDTNITRKVFEKKDKDGKVVSSYETIYRGKARVMLVIRRPNKDGVMIVTARSYLAGGELVLTESDEDHDGTLETLACYSPAKNEMEVFIRQPDGSVKPVSAKNLEAFKKQNAAVSQFWDKAFEKDTSGEELSKSIRATQKKIQNAEREKK
jgi:hypothetical protein